MSTKIDHEHDTRRFNAGAGELYGILTDIDVVQTFVEKKQQEAYQPFTSPVRFAEI